MNGRGKADERTEYECACRARRHVEPYAGVLVPFGALICKASSILVFFGATLDFRRAKWGRRWWVEADGWLEG
jgi:hypothetical protein